ncbi:MAG: TetR family transcriptional regulator C-terminal domain-containing protein [Acidimicrobiia bacterium]|nr:TetR family transcriptional regulator C-terminal domain-containing protein [Acidimicrobiia bacterium]
MPIQVDVAQRRADIAEATFAVAAEAGLGAVTLRSVASKLGASTTIITNYLPTRADLLANALDQVADEWIAELDVVSADLEPEVALREVMRAAVSWDERELIRNQFWVAVLAEPNRPDAVVEQLREESDVVRGRLAKLVEQCGHPDPALAADQLFLFAQGVFVSIVETPQRWSPTRLRTASDAVVDGVLGSY